MKFPWNKKDNKDKEKKISEVNFKNELDGEEVIQNPAAENRKKNIIKNEQKFRFDNTLYSFDTLPDSTKQTLSLLTKSDKLIKLYKQKVDILNFTKRSLNESLKRSLKSIKESDSIMK